MTDLNNIIFPIWRPQTQEVIEPLEIIFVFEKDETIDFQWLKDIKWKNKVAASQIASLKNDFLTHFKILPCEIEKGVFVNAQLTSTRVLYDENNKITDIWGYFKTLEEVNGETIKFAVLIDNDKQTASLMLNK